jgi:cytidylate kinase
MIIAVDGPTASGKGTIARRLGAHFGLLVLDTGLLYRAVGHGVAQAGDDAQDEAAAMAHIAFPDDLLDDPALRSERIGGYASQVSAHPKVRQALFDRQVAFAGQPQGAVLDGRDIGTVIAPHADAKLYITASVDARAKRRFAEMHRRGEDVTLAAIADDLRARDARDMDRAAAPLKPADDALLLDTSDLTIEQAVRQAIALVERRIESRS